MPYQSQCPRAKRPRGPGADKDARDNETGPRIQRRRIKKPTVDTTLRKVQFACPFAEHNPQLYMKKRPCCGPEWIDLRRAKEHLYIRHLLLKFFCPRCFCTRESQVEHNRHSRANPPCKTIELNPNPDDGLNQDQKSTIRSRKYHAIGSGPVSEADKWNQIYRTCVPMAEEAEVPPLYSQPSPDVNDFGAFLLQPIPATIREQIRTDIELKAKMWQEHGLDIPVDFIADIILRKITNNNSAYLGDRQRKRHCGSVYTSAGFPVLEFSKATAAPLVTSLAQITSQFTIADSSSSLGYHTRNTEPIHVHQEQAHALQRSPTSNYAAKFGSTDLRRMKVFNGDLLKDMLW